MVLLRGGGRNISLGEMIRSHSVKSRTLLDSPIFAMVGQYSEREVPFEKKNWLISIMQCLEISRPVIIILRHKFRVLSSVDKDSPPSK